jgi:DNA helicase IV
MRHQLSYIIHSWKDGDADEALRQREFRAMDPLEQLWKEDGEMANVSKTAAQAVKRAKTVISQAKRKGEELATELAKQPAVRQARKKVARMPGQAAALATKVTDKVTGRARKRKRAKVTAAVVGAAAVATAAGISIARQRKR